MLRVLVPLMLLTTGAFLLVNENLTAFFRVPGVAPHLYPINETRLTIEGAPMTSKAHRGEPLPYDGETFCADESREREVENSRRPTLTRLWKDVLAPTHIAVLAVSPNSAGPASKGGTLCTTTLATGHKDEGPYLDELIKLIEMGYHFNWIVDGVPCLSVHKLSSRDGKHMVDRYELGHALGYVTRGQVWVFTHVQITLNYYTLHERPHPLKAAVHDRGQTWISISDVHIVPSRPQLLMRNTSATIVWTYGVDWRPSSVALTTSWDAYLMTHDHRMTVEGNILSSVIAVVIAISFFATHIYFVVMAVVSRVIGSPASTRQPTGYGVAPDERPPVAVGEEEDLEGGSTKGRGMRAPVPAAPAAVVVVERQQRPAWYDAGHDACTPPDICRPFLAAFVASGLAISVFLIVFISQEPLLLVNREYRHITLVHIYVSAAFLAPAVGGFVMGTLFKAMECTQGLCMAATYGSLTIPLPLIVWILGTSGFLEGRGFATLSLGWEYVGLGVVLLLVTYVAWWIGMLSIGMQATLMTPILQKPRLNVTTASPSFSSLASLVISYLTGGVTFYLAAIVMVFLGHFCSIREEIRCLTMIHWTFLYLLILVTTVVSVAWTYCRLSVRDGHWWWRSFFIGTMPAVHAFQACVVWLWTKGHLAGLDGAVVYISYALIGSLLLGLLLGSVSFVSSFLLVRSLYNRPKND